MLCIKSMTKNYHVVYLIASPQVTVWVNKDAIIYFEIGNKVLLTMESSTGNQGSGTSPVTLSLWNALAHFCSTPVTGILSIYWATSSLISSVIYK